MTAQPESTQASGVTLIPPGRYTYRLEGSMSTALGHRDYDGQSVLTVDPPEGNRQHTSMQGDDGSTEQTIVGRASGLFLASIEMDQQGFHAKFRPDSPVLLMPAKAEAGKRWSWRMSSTDGNYTLHATLRVADADGHATVDGNRESTVTVAAVLDIEGNGMSATIHQRDEATRDGVIVTERSVGDGTAYGTKFHTEATRTLTDSP